MTPTSSQQYWHGLVDRYFDAQTTEAEEARLKAFLLSEEGAASEFDEVRAVMGFAVAMRRNLTPTSELRPQPLKRPRRVWQAVAASCMLCLAIGVSVYAYRGHNSDCMAYIDGQRVTNQALVLREMETTLRSAMSEDTSTPTLEGQMSDLFSTLETSPQSE